MSRRGRNPVQVNKITYVRTNVFRFHLSDRNNVFDLMDFLGGLNMSFRRVSLVKRKANKTIYRNRKVKGYGGGLKVFEVDFVNVNLAGDVSDEGKIAELESRVESAS